MMGTGRYILNDDHSIRRADDLLEWAEYMEKGNRRVLVDMVGDYRVSTVFLGLNHNFSPDGSPLLFETMCFDKDGDEVDMIRYETWDQAVYGHKEIVRRMIERVDPAWLVDRGYKLLGVDKHENLDEI